MSRSSSLLHVYLECKTSATTCMWQTSGHFRSTWVVLFRENDVKHIIVPCKHVFMWYSCVLLIYFQEKDSVQCLCVWLRASAPTPLFNEMREHFTDAEYRTWTTEDLQMLLLKLIKNNSAKVALQGFKIFLPVSLILSTLPL